MRMGAVLARGGGRGAWGWRERETDREREKENNIQQREAYRERERERVKTERGRTITIERGRIGDGAWGWEVVGRRVGGVNLRISRKCLMYSKRLERTTVLQSVYVFSNGRADNVANRPDLIRPRTIQNGQILNIPNFEFHHYNFHVFICLSFGIVSTLLFSYVLTCLGSFEPMVSWWCGWVGGQWASASTFVHPCIPQICMSLLVRCITPLGPHPLQSHTDRLAAPSVLCI